MRLRLGEMDSKDRAIASKSISVQLENSLAILQPRLALAFVPLASEPEWWLNRSIDRTQFAYPRVSENGATFYRIDSPDQLAPGRFGILEPPPVASLCVDVAEAEIILVPGLAFDAEGHRLGRGRGYYDAILEKTSADCRRIGVAFDLQIVARVPAERHDQRVNAIVTPAGFIPSPLQR